MKLEGVSAPFELVLEGAERVTKQLDSLSKKAEKLERLKIGAKGTDIDLSGVDKAISDVEARLERTMAKFSKMRMPKSLEGTDLGNILGTAGEKQIERASTVWTTSTAGSCKFVKPWLPWKPWLRNDIFLLAKQPNFPPKLTS